MCCLLLIGLIAPRFLIVFLWIFTRWIDRAFNGFLWPLLGLIFAPYTTLWYSVAQNWFHGEWRFWQIIVLVIAILADLSANGKGIKKYKN